MAWFFGMVFSRLQGRTCLDKLQWVGHMKWNLIPSHGLCTGSVRRTSCRPFINLLPTAIATFPPGKDNRFVRICTGHRGLDVLDVRKFPFFFLADANPLTPRWPPWTTSTRLDLAQLTIVTERIFLSIHSFIYPFVRGIEVGVVEERVCVCLVSFPPQDTKSKTVPMQFTNEKNDNNRCRDRPSTPPW